MTAIHTHTPHTHANSTTRHHTHVHTHNRTGSKTYQSLPRSSDTLTNDTHTHTHTHQHTHSTSRHHTHGHAHNEIRPRTHFLVCLSLFFLLNFLSLKLSAFTHATGRRRLVGSPKLQIIFHKRATKYRSLLRKMTYKDKGSYESSPPCITLSQTLLTLSQTAHTHTHVHIHNHIRSKTVDSLPDSSLSLKRSDVAKMRT